MAAPSSTSSRRTFWPLGPVWWVTSCMPRISLAFARTSSSDLATFTPPPLPRPPAWIWAFTTQTFPPRPLAASTASSTEKHGVPRGVTTPYLRNNSLPWYSWIFMLFYPPTVQSAVCLCTAPIPLRIQRAHGLGARLEGVALVDLERLPAVVGRLPAFPGKGLDRCSREKPEHLGNMRASMHSSQPFPHFLPEAVHKVQADQLRIGRPDGVASAWIGHRI